MAEKISAIYKISFKPNPSLFYIGSAVDFFDRKIRHKYHLNSNQHKNKRLQRMFNKYGAESLVFDIIEIVFDSSKLIEKEQHHIDTLNPSLNMLRVAGSCLGYKHSDSTRRLISSSNKGRKMTDEQNRKNSLAQKGNKNAKGSVRSEQQRELLRKLKSKPVIDLESGKIYDSVKEAAAFLGFKYQTVYAKLTNRITNNINLSFL
jgi:group I intron endonuclease